MNDVNQLPMDKRLLVTNHDALSHFSQAYRFSVAGVVIPSVSDEAARSSQHMSTLFNIIKNRAAPDIFLDMSEN
jgi:zinc/manganese transport system substrate-binding protein